MKKFRRLFAVMMILAQFCAVTTVFALESVAEKQAKLERQYGIKITAGIVTDADGAYLRLSAIENTDEPSIYEISKFEDTISYIPMALHDYVRNKSGKVLTVKLIEFPFAYFPGGLYDDKSNTIIVEGYGPFIHEYGHMLDYVFLRKISGFKEGWIKLNEGVAYGGDYNSLSDRQKSAFVGDYAFTQYAEDIAETFKVLAGNGAMARDARLKDTPLARKLDYLENALESLVGSGCMFPGAHPSEPSAWALESVDKFNNVLHFGTPVKGMYRESISRADFCVYATRIMASISQSKFRGDNLIERQMPQWGQEESLPPFADMAKILNTDTGEYGEPVLIGPAFNDTVSFDITDAYTLGIVSGYEDQTFRPGGRISRQEAAVMLFNMCGVFGQNTHAGEPIAFADSADIAVWAEQAVDFVSATGIMQGMDDKLFSPRGTYTYEQTCVSMVRLYDYLVGSDDMPADDASDETTP
jgi:hypothetical protein